MHTSFTATQSAIFIVKDQERTRDSKKHYLLLLNYQCKKVTIKLEKIITCLILN